MVELFRWGFASHGRGGISIKVVWWRVCLLLLGMIGAAAGGESAPGIVELRDPERVFPEGQPSSSGQQGHSMQQVHPGQHPAPWVSLETAAPILEEGKTEAEGEGPELRLQGLHDWLEEEAATTAIIQYIGQYYVNARGGLSTSNGRYRGNFDIWLYTDTEKSGLWENGTVGLYFQATHGQTLTREETGDYFFYSLLETLPLRNDVTQLGELWYEHRFFDEKLSIRAGKLDGYLYLAFQEMSDGFLNTAFTLIPPTPLPSWPFQVLGVYSKYVSDSGVEVRVASYESKDAGPQYFLPYTGDRGMMTFVEGVVPWEALGDEAAGSLRGGMWYDTQSFQEITTGPARVLEGNYGVYAGMQRLLFEEEECATSVPTDCSTDWSVGEGEGCEEEESEEPAQGLYGFVQYGWAPSDRNPLFQFFGGGVVYRGLLPGRDDDLAGLGYGYGKFGWESYETSGLTYEAVVETFYRWQTRKSLYLQPNLQYIANSGGNGRDSFPVGMQFIQKF